jgi:uncharacterized lipoprotein YddW (UPF0748 family)
MAQEAPVKAMWITRYDYATEADVLKAMDYAAKEGMNRVLFQVRGQGAALYDSDLEPRSTILREEFDPLAVAVTAAKSHDLEIEAWMNVMPLWKGTKSPSQADHPYRLHPEWVIKDTQGRVQPLNEHYVTADPSLPEVRAHVAAIAGEIATKYDVDGVHLDYIRYVTDLTGHRNFAVHPEHVTQVVKDIRVSVQAARPGCRVTAAIFPTPIARADVGQDVASWKGVVDAVYPMVYCKTSTCFSERLTANEALVATGIPVIWGIGNYTHSRAETDRQIAAGKQTSAVGYALFSYASHSKQ